MQSRQLGSRQNLGKKGIRKEIRQDKRAQGKYHSTRQKDCKKSSIALSRKGCKKVARN